jgi:SLT domain-containing protein
VLGFQEGGIVTKPTLAMIGEAGPEAVIPLRSGYTFGNINVSITGNTISSELDMRELARKVGDEITKRIKLNIRI